MIGRAPFAMVPGEPNPPSTDPLALLNYALQRNPGSVVLVNAAGSFLAARYVLYGGAEVELPAGAEPFDGDVIRAAVVLDCPVSVAQNLAGPPEEQDAYVLIHVPRAVLDAMDEEARKPSLILVPPGIVRPS